MQQKQLPNQKRNTKATLMTQCPLLFVYIVNTQSRWAHLNKIKKLNDAKEIKDCLIRTAPVL